METISYDNFAKLDIRVGTIISAEPIEGADKLLKLTINLGDKERTVAAGVAEYYKPEELIGKQVPVLANLAPRMLRGVESQGMILAAESEDAPVLIHPDKNIENGSKVK